MVATGRLSMACIKLQLLEGGLRPLVLRKKYIILEACIPSLGYLEGKFQGVSAAKTIA